MGGDYKDWHNAYVPDTPNIRPELQGLPHVAECVVPNDMLPEPFQRISSSELTKQLHKFRQEHKEYPEEFEDKED